MITRIPLASAFLTYSRAAWRERWAEQIFNSNGMPNRSSALAVASITGRSESLPMTIPTKGRLVMGLGCAFKGAPPDVRPVVRALPVNPFRCTVGACDRIANISSEGGHAENPTPIGHHLVILAACARVEDQDPWLCSRLSEPGNRKSLLIRARIAR